MSKNKLQRSADTKLFGVAAGIANYLSVDSTLVRLALVLIALFVWPEIGFVYLALAFILPTADSTPIEPIFEKDPASIG